MTILDKLSQKSILLSDGAWGTFLQAKGLKPGECPEIWNVTHKNDVRQIAEAYIDAGSDIIETMSAIDEASVAVRAARENTGCTVIVTMTFEGNTGQGYHTMMGATPSEMVVAMKEAGASIIGGCCGTTPAHIREIRKALRK